MSDWERFDDDLAGALRRRAGGVSNDPLATESAHRAVLARASAVRRRRAAIAGGGTLTVLLVAGIVALSGGGEGDEVLAPATEPSVAGSTVPDVPSTTGPSISTTPGTTIVVPIPTPTSSMPGYPTSTDLPTTVPGNTDPGSSTVPTTPTTTTINRPPGEYTWDATGGSMTVYWSGSVISLVRVDETTGVTSSIHDQENDRIRVDFSDGSRIECRVENGQLTFDIQ